MKKVYMAPCVRMQVSVQLEVNLLAGSVVTKNTEIQTTGQEVKSIDFSEATFNHVWE